MYRERIKDSTDAAFDLPTVSMSSETKMNTILTQKRRRISQKKSIKMTLCNKSVRLRKINAIKKKKYGRGDKKKQPF